MSWRGKSFERDRQRNQRELDKQKSDRLHKQAQKIIRDAERRDQKKRGK